MTNRSHEPLEGNPYIKYIDADYQMANIGLAIVFEIARLRLSVDGLRATLSQMKADAEAQRRTHK
jgi:hypothetical protein